MSKLFSSMSAAVLLVSLAAFLYSTGSTPEAHLEMGHRYRYHLRFVSDTNSVGGTLRDGEPFVIQFPREAVESQADTTTITNPRHARWAHIVRQTNTGGGSERWVIHSPQIPTGSDTLHLSTGAREFTFGGCQIDSLVMMNERHGTLWNVLVTD